MPIAMLLERLVASKGAGSCAAVSRLLIEQQNGANRSICCSNRRIGSLFAAPVDQLPFASPHIGHADSPTARVDLERGLLSAD